MRTSAYEHINFINPRNEWSHRRYRRVRFASSTFLAIAMALLVLAPSAFTQVGTPGAPSPAPPCNPLVEIVKSLSWPLIAVVIALLYRSQLGRFFQAVGERATRLSVFKVELELVTAAPPAATPMLGDIQHAPSSAQLNDSSTELLEQVQGTAAADYVLINLGNGEEWLTTRLFIGVVMLERMRNLKCLVLTENHSATDRRFVAVVTPAQLRWSLAKRFPWLEVAFVRAYAEAQPGAQPDKLPDPALVYAQFPLIVSDTGAIQPYTAQQVAKRFIDLVQLQQPTAVSVPGIPNVTDEWTSLSGGRLERATWVTRTLLRQLLPDGAFEAWAVESRTEPRAKRIQAVLHFPGANFVALVDTDRGFSRLIDRRALLEELAERGV